MTNHQNRDASQRCQMLFAFFFNYFLTPATLVAAGVPPAVEPWRLARRINASHFPIVGCFGGARLPASLLDRNFLAVLGSRGRSPHHPLAKQPTTHFPLRSQIRASVRAAGCQPSTAGGTPVATVKGQPPLFLPPFHL